jgi:NitT/TauT family transport system ATP-binding protein
MSGRSSQFHLPPSVQPRGLTVDVQSLAKTFPGGVVAIDRIDLQIDEGEFVAILGPSGCGKSTLLRIIAGLEQPTAGRVELDRNKIAYVFQDPHLLPWRNVLGNVALPLELMRVAKPQLLQASRAALEQIGLADAMERYPAQLSGGMKMRVSLARALVTAPKLLLLDEPFAALDEITRQKLDEQLRTLWAAHGMTVLFVTHSTAEATFLSDRAVVLTRRPARIVADLGIDLPLVRAAPLRAESRFAAVTRLIYEALERGGA